MTRRLSKRSLAVSESTPLAISAEAKRMQASGIHVVSLATGEPDFPTPQVVKRAGIEAIEQNFTKYTQAEGIPELRALIAEKFSRENGILVDAARTLVSSGGKHSIFNALSAVIDEGDEVIVPVPYWTSYPELVRLTGGVPLFAPTHAVDQYRLTPENLRNAITSRTRAIILNSPSNPTGVVYSAEELQALGRVIAEAGIYVISDELYEKIIYDGKEHFSIGSMPELNDLAITVNGVSKAFSMTGWRIGYMCGPADVIAATAKLQSQMTSNPSSISQRAAIVALRDAADEAMAMSRAFEHRRDLISTLLADINDVDFPRPEGAFYIFLNVSQYYNDVAPDSTALSRYLLREFHVATVPGSAFGDDRTIRLSYACSESDIHEGTARLSRGLASLR